MAGPTEIYLPLTALVDPDEERARLTKDLAETQVADRPAGETPFDSDFASKAPAPVVQKEREKLAAYKETADKIKGAVGLKKHTGDSHVF